MYEANHRFYTLPRKTRELIKKIRKTGVVHGASRSVEDISSMIEAGIIIKNKSEYFLSEEFECQKPVKPVLRRKKKPVDTNTPKKTKKPTRIKLDAKEQPATTEPGIVLPPTPDMTCKEGDVVLYKNRMVVVQNVAAEGNEAWVRKSYMMKDKLIPAKVINGTRAFITCYPIAEDNGQHLKRVTLRVGYDWRHV